MNNMQRRKFADLFEARACSSIKRQEQMKILREKELKAKVEKQLGITRMFAQIKKLEQNIKTLKDKIESNGVDISYSNELRINDKNGLFAVALNALEQKEIKPKVDLMQKKEGILAAIWSCDNILALKEILQNSRKHFPFEKNEE